MATLKHIVFDFDGVVADTFDILFALSQECDPSMENEDFLAHHDGNVYEEPRIKFTPESARYLYDQYSERISPSHIQHSLEPITALRDNYALFIISSNEEAGIKAVLHNAGIADCFAAVLGYDTHKSKVEKFKILQSEYGVDLSHAVFVTDTLGDIKEAGKVGIATIAVTFGFHSRERLQKGEPYRIVDTWEEVMQEIDAFARATAQ